MYKGEKNKNKVKMDHFFPIKHFVFYVSSFIYQQEKKHLLLNLLKLNLLIQMSLSFFLVLVKTSLPIHSPHNI